MGSQPIYRKVFFATYGNLPHKCYFCEEEVLVAGCSGRGLVVHHLNEDHDDNSPENLTATHRKCHSKWHMQQLTPTLQAQRTGPWSVTAREKAATTKTGQSIKQTLQYLTCECGKRSTRSGMTLHQRSSKHELMGH